MRLIPLLLLSSLLPATPRPHPVSPAPAACSRSAGLVLPEGFCAILVGEGLGSVRHIAVAPNGDIFAAVQNGSGVLALRDTDGDGVADVRKQFGPGGGSGIALSGDHLYFATDSRVVRWAWTPGPVSW